jgi:hypothetical protein
MGLVATFFGIKISQGIALWFSGGYCKKQRGLKIIQMLPIEIRQIVKRKYYYKSRLTYFTILNAKLVRVWSRLSIQESKSPRLTDSYTLD